MSFEFVGRVLTQVCAGTEGINANTSARRSSQDFRCGGASISVQVWSA